MNWNMKTVWTMRGKQCAVQVEHRTVEPDGYNAGVHRWNVYGYVWKKNPYFSKFDGSLNMFQPATEPMPLHYGCSCLENMRADSGDVECIKVGSDYNHLHDERYLQMGTPEEAVSVFADATKLFEFLETQA